MYIFRPPQKSANPIKQAILSDIGLNDVSPVFADDPLSRTLRGMAIGSGLGYLSSNKGEKAKGVGTGAIRGAGAGAGASVGFAAGDALSNALEVNDNPLASLALRWGIGLPTGVGGAMLADNLLDKTTKKKDKEKKANALTTVIAAKELGLPSTYAQTHRLNLLQAAATAHLQRRMGVIPSLVAADVMAKRNTQNMLENANNMENNDEGDLNEIAALREMRTAPRFRLPVSNPAIRKLKKNQKKMANMLAGYDGPQTAAGTTGMDSSPMSMAAPMGGKNKSSRNSLRPSPTGVNKPKGKINITGTTFGPAATEGIASKIAAIKQVSPFCASFIERCYARGYTHDALTEVIVKSAAMAPEIKSEWETVFEKLSSPLDFLRKAIIRPQAAVTKIPHNLVYADLASAGKPVSELSKLVPGNNNFRVKSTTDGGLYRVQPLGEGKVNLIELDGATGSPTGKAIEGVVDDAGQFHQVTTNIPSVPMKAEIDINGTKQIVSLSPIEGEPGAYVMPVPGGNDNVKVVTNRATGELIPAESIGKNFRYNPQTGTSTLFNPNSVGTVELKPNELPKAPAQPATLSEPAAAVPPEAPSSPASASATSEAAPAPAVATESLLEPKPGLLHRLDQRWQNTPGIIRVPTSILGTGAGLAGVGYGANWLMSDKAPQDFMLDPSVNAVITAQSPAERQKSIQELYAKHPAAAVTLGDQQKLLNHLNTNPDEAIPLMKQMMPEVIQHEIKAKQHPGGVADYFKTIGNWRPKKGPNAPSFSAPQAAGSIINKNPSGQEMQHPGTGWGDWWDKLPTENKWMTGLGAGAGLLGLAGSLGGEGGAWGPLLGLGGLAAAAYGATRGDPMKVFHGDFWQDPALKVHGNPGSEIKTPKPSDVGGVFLGDKAEPPKIPKPDLLTPSVKTSGFLKYAEGLFDGVNNALPEFNKNVNDFIGKAGPAISDFGNKAKDVFNNVVGVGASSLPKQPTHPLVQGAGIFGDTMKGINQFTTNPSLDAVKDVAQKSWNYFNPTKPKPEPGPQINASQISSHLAGIGGNPLGNVANAAVGNAAAKTAPQAAQVAGAIGGIGGALGNAPTATPNNFQSLVTSPKVQQAAQNVIAKNNIDTTKPMTPQQQADIFGKAFSNVQDRGMLGNLWHWFSNLDDSQKWMVGLGLAALLAGGMGMMGGGGEGGMSMWGPMLGLGGLAAAAYGSGLIPGFGSKPVPQYNVAARQQPITQEVVNKGIQSGDDPRALTDRKQAVHLVGQMDDKGFDTFKQYLAANYGPEMANNADRWRAEANRNDAFQRMGNEERLIQDMAAAAPLGTPAQAKTFASALTALPNMSPEGQRVAAFGMVHSLRQHNPQLAQLFEKEFANSVGPNGMPDPNRLSMLMNKAVTALGGQGNINLSPEQVQGLAASFLPALTTKDENQFIQLGNDAAAQFKAMGQNAHAQLLQAYGAKNDEQLQGLMQDQITWPKPPPVNPQLAQVGQALMTTPAAAPVPVPQQPQPQAQQSAAPKGPPDGLYNGGFRYAGEYYVHPTIQRWHELAANPLLRDQTTGAWLSPQAEAAKNQALEELKAKGYNPSGLPITQEAWKDYENNVLKAKGVSPSIFWDYMKHNATPEEWQKFVAGHEGQNVDKEFLSSMLDRDPQFSSKEWLKGNLSQGEIPPEQMDRLKRIDMINAALGRPTLGHTSVNGELKPLSGNDMLRRSDKPLNSVLGDETDIRSITPDDRNLQRLAIALSANDMLPLADRRGSLEDFNAQKQILMTRLNAAVPNPELRQKVLNWLSRHYGRYNEPLLQRNTPVVADPGSVPAV